VNGVALAARHSSARAVVSLCVLAAAMTVGCRSVAPTVPEARLAEARAELMRPLPGDMAALYRLRVRSSGGLRLSLLTSGDDGRLTVSESFGSALSVTAWSGGSARLFDLREGCQLEARNLAAALGAGGLPMPQAALLLGGRLPATAQDRVEARPSSFAISGDGWSCLARVAADPWRVLEVEEGSGEGWRVTLDDHTGSLPGSVRLRNPDGQWAELALVRLEWKQGGKLPALPDLPACGT